MSLIKCPNCGKEISDKADKCVNCGKQIEKIKEKFCSECGNEIKESENFCSKCGCPVGSIITNNQTCNIEVMEHEKNNLAIMSNNKSKYTDNKKRKKYLYIALVFVIVCVLGIAAFIFCNDNKVTESKSKLEIIGDKTLDSYREVSINESTNANQEKYSYIKKIEYTSKVKFEYGIFTISEYNSSDEANSYIDYRNNKYKMYHELIDSSPFKDEYKSYYTDEENFIYSEGKYILEVKKAFLNKKEDFKNNFSEALKKETSEEKDVDKEELKKYYTIKLNTEKEELKTKIEKEVALKKDYINNLTKTLDGCEGSNCDEILQKIKTYQTYNLFDNEIKSGINKYNEVINKKKEIVKQVDTLISKVEKSQKKADYDNVKNKIDSLKDSYYDSYKKNWNTKLSKIEVNVYKNSCAKLDYREALRYPDKYKGKSSYWVGEIVQKISDNEFRVSTKCEKILSTRYCTDNVIYLVYYGNDSLIEDDYIKIWGEMDGNYSYTAVLGNSITIPKVIARYVTR